MAQCVHVIVFFCLTLSTNIMAAVIFGKEPVHCPNAQECYCNVFGLCNLNCPGPNACDDRYVLPPYSPLPKGWPYIGWKGQEQDPTFGLPES